MCLSDEQFEALEEHFNFIQDHLREVAEAQFDANKIAMLKLFGFVLVEGKRVLITEPKALESLPELKTYLYEDSKIVSYKVPLGIYGFEDKEALPKQLQRIYDNPELVKQLKAKRNAKAAAKAGC